MGPPLRAGTDVRTLLRMLSLSLRLRVCAHARAHARAWPKISRKDLRLTSDLHAALGTAAEPGPSSGYHGAHWPGLGAAPPLFAARLGNALARAAEGVLHSALACAEGRVGTWAGHL